MDNNSELPVWDLWIGKWGTSQTDWHPLVYHLVDSACVADGLWKYGLTSGARQQFSQWLNLSEDLCGRLLAYWTCLHDLGKATPVFQAKHPATKKKLQEAGFDFPALPDNDIRHHSLLSQWILEDLMSDVIPDHTIMFCNYLRFAIGGHHGTFHVQEDGNRNSSDKKNLGGKKWTVTRRELLLALNELFQPPQLQKFSMSETERNAFFNLLTGFFVTADWISSQDDLFPYHLPTLSLPDYREVSRQRALDALQKTGWPGWQPDEVSPTFQELFQFTPRFLQETAFQATAELDKPFLAIIEAPTGCGKTEAALMIADQAIRRQKLRGWYVAMPTQATSNQMFGRVKSFLSRRYAAQNINLQLVHGNAMLNRDFQRLRFAAVSDSENEHEGNVTAMEWFLPRKRSLLAPFGVGTVDQTFMSVLRVRHGFLRLFGLHRKVVIFDEVHAYDIYMGTLFRQVLAWLRAIGSSVIILSATLPEKDRKRLLETFQPNARNETVSVPYPRLSINDGQKMTTLSLGTYPDRTVYLKPVGRDPKSWLETLRSYLAQGGCAAVICNTVDRAQEVYKAISEAKIVQPEDLVLLHARMPFCWRKQREELILNRSGKRDHAEYMPRRGIVVATQIIEQSLDLDFDLLISELAPVDLLIQRIGRLHRHSGQKYPPLRPRALRDPVCLICQPEVSRTEDTLPNFDKDRYVYDSVFLNRTYFILRPYTSLVLPQMSDSLINRVYSSDPLPECTPEQNQQILKLHQIMKEKSETSKTKAENHLIGDVDNTNVLDGKTVSAREQDALGGGDISGLTRGNILPSVQLVCLQRYDGRTFLVDENLELDLSVPPPERALRNIHGSIVNVSKKEVVDYFFNQPLYEPWKSSSLLRYAHPVVFEDGLCVLNEELSLKLNKSTGLEIHQKD